MNALQKKDQDQISPKEALLLLKEGNQRFVSKKQISRDYQLQINQTSTGQFPFAAVLSCIDSRVPAEIVFDQGIGDIFSARIAGNFVNTDILGSLEFACKLAGSKLILVLGHTSCGAIKGACDNAKLGNLTSMLENFSEALSSVKTPQDPGSRNSSNTEFVNQVCEKNVELTINKILSDSPLLNEMNSNGEINIVGGIYDVSTGKVRYID
tara:strand:+ start:1922 stop:2551 length:630 start_codon:yes stop_codon:yes gene_type:complete